MLLLGFTGPAVLMPSCSSTAWKQVRDAALTGLSDFVQQAVVELLDTTVGTSDTGG